jgi:hypothetical protein
MRLAKKALTLVIGLSIVGGSISVAAAETWHHSHSYRLNEHSRFGHSDWGSGFGWRYGFGRSGHYEYRGGGYGGRLR